MLTSILIYGFYWIINTPQKFVNKIAYIINIRLYPSIYCVIDMIPNILAFTFIELPLAVIDTTVGTIIAFILTHLTAFVPF